MKKNIKILLIIVSLIGLVLTVGPSFLAFNGTITLHTHKVLMMVGTLIWFGSAPFWIGKKSV